LLAAGKVAAVAAVGAVGAVEEAAEGAADQSAIPNRTLHHPGNGDGIPNANCRQACQGASALVYKTHFHTFYDQNNLSVPLCRFRHLH